MTQTLSAHRWSECVVLVDGDYVDKVAFDLTVNFERMLGRRIPKADMAQWLVCAALDGGLRDGDHEVQVVITHAKDKEQLEYFTPGHFENELNGKAFKDTLGEFVISSVPVESSLVETGDFFLDALAVVANSSDVKRLIVVPDAERIYNNVRETLRKVTDEAKHITVLTMQPMPGGNFQQEILGYSLMSALGISGDELNKL